MPIPFHENTVSVSTALVSSTPSVTPMIVITGVSALRSTWWRITSPSRETLGAGGADVVGVQLVEHRRPHEPRDDAHQAQPSTNAGSISWRRHCHARLEVAGEQRVDRVEPVDVGGGSTRDGRRPGPGNQPSRA